jgi:hypothetical protein
MLARVLEEQTLPEIHQVHPEVCINEAQNQSRAAAFKAQNKDIGACLSPLSLKNFSLWPVLMILSSFASKI